MSIQGKYIFHVHTRRCGHAEEVEDEAYVKRAVSLGAETIYFTDHAPFPGDPFRNRMSYQELTEYVSSLKELHQKYEGIINIKIGLETEYLPSFKAYYEELRGMKDMDLLILGQHHSETPSGLYSFEMENKSDEWKYLMEGQTAGAESGYFDIIAHPDRLFKREKQWTEEMKKASERFISKAIEHSLTLEKNLSSIRRKRQYRDSFWNLVLKNVPIIVGCDAHAVDEIVPWWVSSEYFVSSGNLHDFINELNQHMDEAFPETERILIKGCDYIKKVVLELRQDGKSLPYSPYALYKSDRDCEAAFHKLSAEWRATLSEVNTEDPAYQTLFIRK
ncbi:MAG: PHP domain-containing protein [Bacillota bacterium]|nr:PHP domain-containing protein [Bacillota bacterium]